MQSSEILSWGKLNNVSFKLDALLRNNLLSSHTFLKEGVGQLNAFLEKQNVEQKPGLNEASKDVGGETSRMHTCMGSTKTRNVETKATKSAKRNETKPAKQSYRNYQNIACAQANQNRDQKWPVKTGKRLPLPYF